MSPSAVGETIMWAILKAQNGSKSPNELKRDGFNGVTVTRQLRKLEGERLIRREKVMVRGGWQHRYSLTEAGRQWLIKPVEIFRIISGAIGRLIYAQDDIDLQLYGSDLIRGAPHLLALTARLKLNARDLKLMTTYEMDDDWNTRKSKIRVQLSKSIVGHKSN